MHSSRATDREANAAERSQRRMIIRSGIGIHSLEEARVQQTKRTRLQHYSHIPIGMSKS